jgi:hypothetical protein
MGYLCIVVVGTSRFFFFFAFDPYYFPMLAGCLYACRVYRNCTSFFLPGITSSARPFRPLPRGRIKVSEYVGSSTAHATDPR